MDAIDEILAEIYVRMMRDAERAPGAVVLVNGVPVNGIVSIEGTHEVDASGNWNVKVSGLRVRLFGGRDMVVRPSAVVAMFGPFWHSDVRRGPLPDTSVEQHLRETIDALTSIVGEPEESKKNPPSGGNSRI